MKATKQYQTIIIGERIQFETPTSDNSDENQSLETSATDLSGNKLDECSDGSDSSDQETDIDKKHYNLLIGVHSNQI